MTSIMRYKTIIGFQDI